MLDQLKALAMQKLMSKMAGNSLGASETQNAAEAGASGLMESITGALAGGGGIDQIKNLLSGDSAEGGGELVDNIKSKIQNSLQEQGMSEEEAAAEAESTTPDLINGLKEKFNSDAEEDSAFSLESLTGLIGGGGMGDLLGKAGGIMDAGKSLFGK